MNFPLFRGLGIQPSEMAISLAIKTLHHGAIGWLLFLTAEEEFLFKRGTRANA
jgi:hypothetical protein